MSLGPSSPRLPSPPPPAEIQLGPKSPAGGPVSRQAQQMEQMALDANAKRRIHPGTKSCDMAAGPPLVPLNEVSETLGAFVWHMALINRLKLDSAFQLQEHLAALHYFHTASGTIAMTRETSRALATPPPGTDRTLWLYEVCRFLIAQCNQLIVGFLFDAPPCCAATCPEMRASEWQFLCAVHESPKSCCAIDYCCHTLDWAANVVTDPKLFPSRFVAPTGGNGGFGGADGRSQALKNLVNVFRRLHRIFAHAWYQHRDVFWAVECRTGLYVLFKTLCDVYDLLPIENYKLPPEAEGLDSSERKPDVPFTFVPTSMAKNPLRRGSVEALDDEETLQPVGRTSTRRHIRSNPSTGSAVTTVMEADENDEAGGHSKMFTSDRWAVASAPETLVKEGDPDPEADASETTREVVEKTDTSASSHESGLPEPSDLAGAERPPETLGGENAGSETEENGEANWVEAETADPEPEKDGLEGESARVNEEATCIGEEANHPVMAEEADKRVPDTEAGDEPATDDDAGAGRTLVSEEVVKSASSQVDDTAAGGVLGSEEVGKPASPHADDEAMQETSGLEAAGDQDEERPTPGPVTQGEAGMEDEASPETDANSENGHVRYTDVGNKDVAEDDEKDKTGDAPKSD